MRTVTIGKHAVRLWLIVLILVATIGGGTLGYIIWKTFFISVEVKEPIEVLNYPSQLTLYPGETRKFNVTLLNRASVSYSIIFDFHLANSTYQSSFVTFSNNIYKVVPGQQNLTAWLRVEPSASLTTTTLTVNIKRIDGITFFSDDYSNEAATTQNWTEQAGTWSVVNGEYYVAVGVSDNGISTANTPNITNCIIEARLRFSDTYRGFRAGIVFRYIDNEHYYSFEISNEYDLIIFGMYTPADSKTPAPRVSVSSGISANTDYILRVEIHDNTFTGYLDYKKVLSWTDPSNTFALGEVGLRARNAAVYFDNFQIIVIP